MKILIAHLDKCGIYEGPTEVVANLDKEFKKLGQETHVLYETDLNLLLRETEQYSPWADVLVAIGYLGSVATKVFLESKPVIWSWDEVPENHWNLDDVPLYCELHQLSEQENVFIITGTQDDANVIEKVYKRIDYIIPYGIDYELQSRGVRLKRIPPFKILQVGWLGRGKNQMETLKAFLSFLKYNSDSILTLVGGKILLGSGPEYWDKCVNYIKENDLSVIMTGPLPREQVSDYYYKSDVSLNPLNNTGGQLTVMEGICAGLPTIVSTKFVLRDIVQNYGIVTDDYVGALKMVYGDWNKYHLRALEGREWIKDNFTWSRWAKDMLEVIKKKV